MAEDDRAHGEDSSTREDPPREDTANFDTHTEPEGPAGDFRIEDGSERDTTFTEPSADLPDAILDAETEPETGAEESLDDTAETGADRSAQLGWTFATVSILLVGIALQIGYYWRNRALWLDEADLAMNILDRSFGELFQPLADNQSAPLGFLLLVKVIVTIFGPTEFTLRAVPLVCGVVGLVLVYLLARKVLEAPATTLAVSVCAVSFPLIRYASEFKQYAMDFAVSTSILLMAVHVAHRPLRIGWVIGFALLGFFAVWFSHASVFVLAGTGTVLGLHAVFTREWKRALSLVLVGLTWFSGFAVHYLVLLRHYQENEALRSWHTASFAPIPPWTPTAAKWYVWTFVDMFEHPLGLLLPGLGAFAFVTGCGVMARRAPLPLAVILLPAFIALGVSAAQIYPFTERFLLFLVSPLALTVGAGTAALVRFLWPQSRWVATVFVVLLLVQPVMVAANEIRKPPWEGVRPAVDYLTEHQEPDDRLYVYHWVRNAFRYYVRERGVDVPEYTIGITSRNDWEYYRDEIENLRGNKRVWFLMNEAASHLQHGEPMFYRTTLDSLGTRLDEQRWGDVMLYLYDLSGVNEPVSAPTTRSQPSAEAEPDVEPQEEQ